MHNNRPPIATVALMALLVAACAAAPSRMPDPSAGAPVATPTPVAMPVTSPEEAAVAVVASDPRFTGAVRLSPDLIGASRWWEARALDGGSFEVVLTVGWGDCPSGCINRHIWTFRVDADGTLTLLDETGPEVPSGALPA